jgi:tRNA threonylcarbamoyl adenosine modification protein (Sua5/YciO/YrdC/YwlC family)
LEATRDVPKRLVQPKRKTIGLRVPDHPIPQALLQVLDEPLMSATLALPDEEDPMTDPYDIRDQLEHEVDLVIDGGFCGPEATSVIDLTGSAPIVLRRGVGDVSDFEGA